MALGPFHEFVGRIDFGALKNAIESVGPESVERTLKKEGLDDSDAIALFSPAATDFAAQMTEKSAAVTERRFGKVIQLYAPLYLSNECANSCLYCGFSSNVKTKRISLTPDEALAEAEHLHNLGFRHILLVTGEMRSRYGVDEILEAVKKLTGRFASISIEVFPMSAEEYKRLETAGVDALTLYQETYLPDLYAELHPKGPKSRYDHRLDAIENGGIAGFRSLGVGALLGLADWRIEAVLLAMHARYLMRRFWKSRIAVSFPRVNPAETNFMPSKPVSDDELIQMIVGMRLLLPDAELVISTRERAEFRDRLIGLGITRMSAGSRTNPGGYLGQNEGGRQFSVADERSAKEVAAMIERKGLDPVWKDFDPAFISENQ
jgi:2-iminoacetate synthase